MQHKAHLEKALQKCLFQTGVTIALTGSRQPTMQLSYPESDIDFAFVGPNLTALKQVRDAVVQLIENKEFYQGCTFPFGFNFETKAGLPWLPVEGCKLKSTDGAGLGNVSEFFEANHGSKIDITFRTQNQHAAINAHLVKEYPNRFPKESSRLAYIQSLRFLKKAKSDATVASLVLSNIDGIALAKESAAKAEAAYMAEKNWLMFAIPGPVVSLTAASNSKTEEADKEKL